MILSANQTKQTKQVLRINPHNFSFSFTFKHELWRQFPPHRDETGFITALDPAYSISLGSEWFFCDNGFEMLTNVIY